MSNRYARKVVESAFKALIAQVGGKVIDEWNDVGAYRLDYNAIYGGYIIEKIVNTSGGVTCPFGHARMRAREFCAAMEFAASVLREAKIDNMELLKELAQECGEHGETRAELRHSKEETGDLRYSISEY